MPTHLRRLTSADVPLYVALRAEMLADAPWAFGASPGHDRGSDSAHLRTALDQREYAILGAFEDDALRATAGVLRESSPKFRHIATIWGVYCTPSARGRGLGRAVVTAALDTARTWPGVARVRLGVSANSPTARALYESLGFVAWGVEPDCIRVNDMSYDELHMSMPLLRPSRSE